MIINNGGILYGHIRQCLKNTKMQQKLKIDMKLIKEKFGRHREASSFSGHLMFRSTEFLSYWA